MTNPSSSQPASEAAASLFALALRQHQAGNLDEAERVYKEAIARDPKHFDSLHLLGVAAQQRGRYDVAIELIGRAIALNDRVSTFHNNLAEALRVVGRSDEAVAHARRAIELEPTFAEAHVNLGNALKQQGKIDEAAEQYERALRLNPNYVAAHANLGVARMDQGHLEEAIASYTRALALQPNFPAGEMNLGIALHRKGEWDEAVAHYRRALELQPNYVLAHMNLGDTLFDQGNVDEAISQYETALRITTGGFGPDSKALKPAESVAVMSTGKRPLYPVEDKCVMSLVRAHSWRAPLGEWDRLCAAALKHDGFCPESRYELAIRTAIGRWIAGDYSGLTASLEQGRAVFGQIQKPNDNVENSRAYEGFLRALSSYVKENPQIRAIPRTSPVVAIVGDSHCLAYDATTIRIDGVAYCAEARLILGCKAWHLANGKQNRFKERFNAIVDDLPPNSTAICTLGEIDCRVDEGILPHYRKVGGDLAELVANEVELFADYVTRAAAPRSIRLMLLGVPAPNFAAMPPRDPALTDDDKRLLIDVIRLFNLSLQRATAGRNLRFVDLYSLTGGTDGTASGRHHLDDIHLKPDVLSLAVS